MHVTYRPLGNDWVGERTPEAERRRARFYGRTGVRTAWSMTMFDLDRELRYLEAESVVFQIDVREADIRLDGLPNSRALVTDSGVIVSFESKFGPLRYACDRFQYWQDNVRAIALGLEALRTVDRYGITKRGEQYSGWKALPPSTGVLEGVVVRFNSPQDAGRYMLSAAGDHGSLAAVLEDKTYRDEIFRRASKRVHPDATDGGDRQKWDQLVEARRLLEGAPA